MGDEKKRATALISGGLDSILAARLILDQGLEVVGMHFRHPFIESGEAGSTPLPAERAAEQLDIRLVQVDLSQELFNLLKDPPHGFGKALNPCIDCRIEQLKKAGTMLPELGAGFMVTGEVLGQRPMSQRKDAMNIIDRDSGMKGLVLRPLSARLLKPTIPEEKGWVDRERLLDIAGRGRKVQMALAEKYSITEYTSPAGGCLLTEEGYVSKLRDLMEHAVGVSEADVKLLRLGRHFRISDKVKAVVGKNDADNKRIINAALPSDLLARTDGVPGPVTLVRGPASREDLITACAITGRYVNKVKGKVPFAMERVGLETEEKLNVEPLTRVQVEKYRIN